MCEHTNGLLRVARVVSLSCRYGARLCKNYLQIEVVRTYVCGILHGRLQRKAVHTSLM